MLIVDFIRYLFNSVQRYNLFQHVSAAKDLKKVKYKKKDLLMGANPFLSAVPRAGLEPAQPQLAKGF